MATRSRTDRSLSGCGFEGCDRPHDAEGYCQGHYRQLSSGKTLAPIQARNRPKNKVTCDRCNHSFYPRTENHGGKCSACRGKFGSDLSKTREKSKTAPEGKRWCRGCERYRAAKFFPNSSARCKPCLKVYTEDQRAQKVYNIPPGAYAALYEAQGGVCYICRRATGERRSLAVDHDHSCCPGAGSCGKCVRGLLCKGCNYKILGHLRDDPEALRRAILYLKMPPAQGVLANLSANNRE